MEELLAVLRDGHALARRWAITILEDFGSRAAPAVPLLAQMVHDSDWVVARREAPTLAKIAPADPRATRALLEAVGAENQMVCLDALEAIGECDAHSSAVVKVLRPLT